MSSYKHIHDKLNSFVKRYYTNEIIKGGIFFLFFGLLYFFLTLVIEFYLWLEPFSRTILFWLFIFIEGIFLFRFILIPLFKLFGIRKGLTDTEASKIIGKHFKEVDDKLLNIIQLNSIESKNELLAASIDQKSKELRPVSFKKAIVYKKNAVHLKYLLIPLVIWFVVWVTGNDSIFTQSLNRVVHHKTAFQPPAPFYFQVINDQLQTIEDQSFELKFRTVGEIAPENVRVVFGGHSYYATPNEEGFLTYNFDFPQTDIEFFLEGNSVTSKPFYLRVLSAPKITNFSMELKYPSYLNKKSDTISNTGNAIVPVGTEVTWFVDAQNTDILNFSLNGADGEEKFEKRKQGDQKNTFIFRKKIRSNFSYEIRSSNSNLKDFEILNYSLEALSDEFPKIFVESDMDSVSRGPVKFLGQLTDDYGISRLQVVAKDIQSGQLSIGRITTGYSDFEEFFYVFPEGIILEEGRSYELYFEVYDNDGVKGPKKTVSQIFRYRNKTFQEEQDEILEEQKQAIQEGEKSREKGDELEKSLEEFSKKIKNKKETDWNDQNELDDFLRRQKQYQEMMDRNSEMMQENLEEMDLEEDPLLEEKKEELKDRWEELAEYKEKEELIKELEELAEKLQKEDLLEKIDKLKEQSKQETRSLERILELTKQFYVEKKSAQILKELEKLSEEQLDLSTEESNSSEEQEKLNSKFDSIQKDFEELRDQNEDLKQPLDIFDSKPDEKLIEMDMKKAIESLKESEQQEGRERDDKMKNAKEQQRRAAKRMEELSKKMESGLMEMEMQGVEENIEDLKQILKNLLRFSLDQEELMLSFDQVSAKNADFPKKLKEQVKLKEHFEHIDDSLYALSLRMVRLSSKIQEDIGSAHYNLDKSLENIADNRIQQGMSNQQYTMTAANNLADLLSDMLQSLQNQKPGSGKGKGKEGEMSLPDIIKKQQGMMKKMKDGMEGKEGEGKKGKEAMSGEQFQMYQEQKMLKDQMQQLLDREGTGGKNGKEALSQMEELEKILLEKGISKESLQRMQKLEQELLELENAALQRNKDNKREAETNRLEQQFRDIENIKRIMEQDNENELLRRKRLELAPDYKRRVKEYFEQEER